jgi:hypothetical protein
MKTPRITDFDPDAKVQPLKSPLDGMPPIGKPPQQRNNATPSPLSEKPAMEEEQGKGKKPAKVQTRKAANLSPADFDKVEKYTTHIEPSLMKKIKLWAVEKDMKDYDVVRAALIQYFENNK